jgi:predicted nucleic acid-binding protein
LTILPDTSAWVEYLRRTGSQVNHRMRQLLEDDSPIATCDVVMMELAAGARSSAHRRELHRLLSRCRLLPVRPLFDYETAARIYQRCRQSGVTPRSLSDCLVATVAIGNDVPLLHADADFDRMAPVIGLQLA